LSKAWCSRKGNRDPLSGRLFYGAEIKSSTTENADVVNSDESRQAGRVLSDIERKGNRTDARTSQVIRIEPS
jgi:hypothetical protein